MRVPPVGGPVPVPPPRAPARARAFNRPPAGLRPVSRPGTGAPSRSRSPGIPAGPHGGRRGHADARLCASGQPSRRSLRSYEERGGRAPTTFPGFSSRTLCQPGHWVPPTTPQEPEHTAGADTMTSRKRPSSVRAAKARMGLGWAQLAEGIGAPVPWTVSARSASSRCRPSGGRAVGILNPALRNLTTTTHDVAEALQAQPSRGALGSRYRPTRRSTGSTRWCRSTGRRSRADPRGVRRRHHERDQLPVDVARVPDPAGDRVVVTLDSKFLPYQWCRPLPPPPRRDSLTTGRAALAARPAGR